MSGLCILVNENHDAKLSERQLKPLICLDWLLPDDPRL